MTREDVLTLLLAQPDRPLSGEAMSRQLGVSRAAVWKAIEALRQEGYVISSAPNRGYRLESAPDRLREGELSGRIADCQILRRVACLDVIDSTNTECKRPKGCGLYLSLLLRPRLEPAAVTDFTAWVAVAVCDSIQAACGIRPRIKWTNDLVLNGKKLCGILTELGLESETNCLEYMVPGIGINVNHRPEDFSEDVRAIATSLAIELGHPVRRADLAAELIRALDRMYRSFPDNKQEYLDRYRADCLTPGNRVQLITPTSRQEATALAIDDDFRLVVELPDGARKALSAGEVSVRGMYGYV